MLSEVKHSNGQRYMVIVTSNGYQDREEEFVSANALAGYVEKSWRGDVCQPNNNHLFWHDGDPIGEIVWCDMVGPFLVEVSKELPDRTIQIGTDSRTGAARQSTVKVVWDYIEATPELQWGASHGFKYPAGDKERKFYGTIYKEETSTLPVKNAANPFTFSGVVMSNERDKVIDQLLGHGVADKLRAAVVELKEKLDAQGLQHKEMPPAASAPVAPPPPPPNPVEQLVADILKLVPDLMGMSEEERVKRLTALVAKAMTPPAPVAPADPPPPAETVAKEWAREVKASDLILLLDQLIETQGGLVEHQVGQSKRLDEMASKITGLATMSTYVKEMGDAVKALNRNLDNRPRIASRDPASIIANDDPLARKAENVVQEIDSFWGGTAQP